MKKLESKNIDFHATLAIVTENTQSGRSMIEMLGVLAIIGVLSVGGIAGYSKAMQKYRINKTIEQITLIAGNARAFFAPQRNYIGIYCKDSCNATEGCYGYDANKSNGISQNGCPIIKKAKILPDEMITLDSTGKKITAITNPFGGVVLLDSVDKSTSGDNQAFFIHLSVGDNSEACIELLTHDWTAAQVNVISVELGPDYWVRTPVSVDDAVTLCSLDNPEFSFYVNVDTSSNIWSETISDCSVSGGGC